MSVLSPWDFGADANPLPARVCIIVSDRAIIVPMVGAPEVLPYHGILYFRSALFLSGFRAARYLYTAGTPTLCEKRAAESAFRNDEEGP
jgi:hypothetical protein